MAFLDAFHHFEFCRLEIVDGPYAAQYRVHYAGGPVDDKAHRHQPIDHFLDLGLRGAFLHYNKHELPI